MITIYKSTLEANTNIIIEIIPETHPTETNLIQSLTKLACQFAFERLVDLAEPLISNEF